MKAREIIEYFEQRQDAIIATIRELVDLESPSFDYERSSDVAAWVERSLESIPLDFQLDRSIAQDTGEHLVVRVFPSDARSFFLLGHTDTVHPVGTSEKNPTRIEGDKFFGCGIFDMKANIVLMLEALRFFAQTGTRPVRPITILLSCDEEVGSFSGRPLVEREAANAECCLVFEPSINGMVKTGRKGTGMFNLRAHGIPAHAGLEPENGASAILEISRQIERVQGLGDPERGTTVNVCTMRGGTTTNVIPEHAECTIDVRFASAAEAARINSAICGLRPVDTRVSLEVVGEINRPPMERTAEVVRLYEKARELAASYGYDLGETQVGGASDGNFVGALGVPVLDGLGITGAGAHTLHEHILVSDIASRATLVTLLLSSD